MRTFLHSLALTTAIAGFSTAAAAEDRALIIGIGTYQNPGNDLPGIDKDIEQASDIARRMGFSAPVMLKDAAATRRGILDALRAALVVGVSANDRVFIYYSGHGTQVPDANRDETDNSDEALVAYDVRVTTNTQGQDEIRGVVIDDEIESLLKESASKNIFLIVDACNSGTIDKSINFRTPVMGYSNGVKKFYSWANSKGKNKSFGVVGNDDAQTGIKYVSMTAAADDQSAIATKNGSAFTVGLAQGIASKSADGAVTPKQLVELATNFINTNMASDARSTPELHGSPDLINRVIKLSNTRQGNGPNWIRVNDLIAGLQPLVITDVKAKYTDGEALSVSVDSPVEGYLNLLSVGADDTLTLLYPNKFEPENKISAGKVRIPTDRMPFKLPAQAPFGKSMIVAVVTSQPYNLLQTSVDRATTPALATPALGALLQLTRDLNSSRNFGVEGRTGSADGTWGGKVIAEVCSADGRCQ